MATRRHAVVLLVLCAVLWSTGGISPVLARVGVCSCRCAQCHRGRGPAPGAPGVARPLVVVAWERGTGGRRLDAGFCRRHQADHRRERDLPRVYRAAVRGAAEPLGAPRAHPPRGLADPPARPAWAGLFLCGAVDLGGVGWESVCPGKWAGYGVARGVLTQGHGGTAAHPRARQSPGGHRGAPFLEGATLAPVHWGLLLVAGVGQLGISTVPREGDPHVRAIEAIMIPSIEPVLNPLWVWLLVGEVPSGWALVGGTIVVGAVTARGLTCGTRHARTWRRRPRAETSAREAMVRQRLSWACAVRGRCLTPALPLASPRQRARMMTRPLWCLPRHHPGVPPTPLPVMTASVLRRSRVLRARRSSRVPSSTSPAVSRASP